MGITIPEVEGQKANCPLIANRDRWLDKLDLLEAPNVGAGRANGETMAFIDPNRPEIDPAEQLLPRHNPGSAVDDRPRMDGWTANRPRSSGLMLAGGIMGALVIAGWVTFSSGKFKAGNVTNTPPATISQPTTAPAGSSVGQAPAH
jgi:hypothetical protein